MGTGFPRDQGIPSVRNDSDPARWRENPRRGRADLRSLPRARATSRHAGRWSWVCLGPAEAEGGGPRARGCRCERVCVSARGRGCGGAGPKREGTGRAEIWGRPWEGRPVTPRAREMAANLSCVSLAETEQVGGLPGGSWGSHSLDALPPVGAVRVWGSRAGGGAGPETGNRSAARGARAVSGPPGRSLQRHVACGWAGVAGSAPSTQISAPRRGRARAEGTAAGVGGWGSHSPPFRIPVCREER